MKTILAAIAATLTLTAIVHAAPKPNEYDAGNERYWNAEHGHWHRGRPPTGK